MAEEIDPEVLEFDEEAGEVEDTDDGGAIIRVAQNETPDPEETGFYDNIVDELDALELELLVNTLHERVENDKKSREKRSKEYEDALKRTGLGDEAPGGATFEGASKVVHPMLTEAVVDFSSRAISELMPPSGPVKTSIIGTPTKERVNKAERKTRYMNWQLKTQMPEFRSELEQLLTQLPLGGSQFLRLVYDSVKKRPVPVFVPIDDVHLPYAASNYYTAERITYVEYITQFEYDRRVSTGQYRDLPLQPPPSFPEQTRPEKANEKIEGKAPDPTPNQDGLREIWEVQTYAELEGGDDDSPAPYLITIDPHNKGVLSVVRNWEEDDENREPLFWTIEWGFVPWRGAYHIGLNQMMAGLPAATTGTLRALLDSAHINNLPSLLKLKGANFSGQSKEFSVATVTEVEGGIAGDNDIRKLIMPIPFNPPSTVLFSLLGFLVDAGKGVVRTTFDNLSDGNQANMPVGTTLALIEQGMKVMSAIHLRLWGAMDQTIRLLHRINRMYMDDKQVMKDTGELLAKRSDFQEPIDVLPTAEPEVFSDVQRFAQMQLVAQRASALPQLYDLRKVELMILKRTKIPDAEDLLLPAPQPMDMNAVNENVAATMGRPIMAFPEQDHLAHIQVHVDFLTSPIFGMLQTIAPTYIPVMLGHLKEHMILWYANEFHRVLTEEMGEDIGDMMKYKDPETRAEIDKTLAAASPDIVKAGGSMFQKLPPIIAQAGQLIQQMSPPVPSDPGQVALQTAQITAQSRAQSDQARQRTVAMQTQARVQETQFKESSKMQQETMRQEREDQRQGQKTEAELARESMQQHGETQRSREDNLTREQINTQDNLTAVQIAEAEIDSGERVAVSKGTGINPGE